MIWLQSIVVLYIMITAVDQSYIQTLSLPGAYTHNAFAVRDSLINRVFLDLQYALFFL